MELGLAGRVALVTAASKGLGRASAEALSAEGASVVICARGQAALDEAAEAMGGDVLAIAADVTEPDVPQQLVDATLSEFGRLDVLVANAGGPPRGRALDVDDAGLERAINANLLTSIRLVRSALPPMRAQGWGRICCITSMSVKQPIPGLALSNTARTGLWAWAKTAAGDLFDEGITLNLACPGTHATDRVRETGAIEPGRRIGHADDFGKVVAFLCSDPARFISGSALAVDGATVMGLL